MTQEEYNRLRAKAHADYEQTMRDLNVKCSLENNPYKVGDIIKDHIGYGRIIKIAPNTSAIAYENNLPACSYWCDNLTKKLEVNKREPQRRIFQSNIREK